MLKLSNEDVEAGNWYRISTYKCVAKYNEDTPYILSVKEIQI